MIFKTLYSDVLSSPWLAIYVSIGAYPLALILNIAIRNLLARGHHPIFEKSHAFFKLTGIWLVWFILLIFMPVLVDIPDNQRQIVMLQSFIACIFIIKFSQVFILSLSFSRLIIYTVVPLILLNAFGILTLVVEALESYAVSLGNIHVSVYDILSILYFSVILFWLGKESSRFGKQKIRTQSHLDNSTKEVLAKLFEVAVYIIIFLILLNLLGINVTTLAVFGGAIGVGIGFGLQSIASNFISGIVILLDRSLSIGDYIELQDGRSGNIRETNLRAVTLETYDGKDIVVPNDIFFSETFTNWTHKNNRQRYSIDFSVAYHTDLDELFPLVIELLKSHPQVLSGQQYSFEEQPDIEIGDFGDNGISLHIEFWMDAIDDGKHRVGGDLLYSLWKLMKAHNFEFPFPQREVRIKQN